MKPEAIVPIMVEPKSKDSIQYRVECFDSEGKRHYIEGYGDINAGLAAISTFVQRLETPNLFLPVRSDEGGCCKGGAIGND